MTYDRRVALEQVFGEAEVEKLRKDFLTLMRAVDQVKTYDEAVKVYNAVRTWRSHYYTIVIEQLADRTYDLLLPTERGAHDPSLFEESKELRGKVYTGANPLGHYITRIPFEPFEDLSEFHQRYMTKERLLQDFLEKRKPYVARMKRLARTAWKTLEDLFYSVRLRSRKDNLTINVHEVLNTKIEGFTVQIIGYDPNVGYHKDPTFFGHALRIFERRAAMIFPWMLSHMLPIVIDYAAGLDVGGNYRPDRILISGTSPATPNVAAHYIAHEMGHHVYKTYLSTEADEFWYSIIRGDFDDLDLKELLQKWPSDKRYVHNLIDAFRKTDPVLSLQLEAVSVRINSSTYIEDFDFFDKAQVEKLVADGTTTIPVPAHPVTAYGNKNAEETFCEVFGLLVSYGPKAVDPYVRSWLRTILPEVRVATYRR